MLFNSYEFIFIFFPIALIGYFLLSHYKKYRVAHFFLMGMSLYFYAYFKVSYLWIMLGSIGWNYVIHRVLLYYREKENRTAGKAVLVSGLLGNLGLLFYFKYFNFFLDNMNAFLERKIVYEQVLLPLGISFFTFQQIAFIVDTYKGGIRKQNFIDYGLFVTFFPQLIAGPIVSHEEMLPQFEDVSKKKLNEDNIYLGARLFIIGLAKKVLLADVFGRAVDWGYQYYTVLDGFNTWLVVIFYSMQLYLDFSGYCDMARGIGYFFNIEIPVNFMSPFKSRNIVEFWKRWHITLGRFFTRYVYIPLGGNRKGQARMLLNIFIVFFLSGIWHGAGWTFVVWGLIHAALQIGTRVWWMVKAKLSIPKCTNKLVSKGIQIVSTIVCFICVAVAFGIFRATDLEQAKYMLSNMMSSSDIHVFTEVATMFQMTEVTYMLRFFELDILLQNSMWQMMAYLGITGIIIWGCKNAYETEKSAKIGVVSICCLAVLFVLSVLNMGMVSSFLYFNF